MGGEAEKPVRGWKPSIAFLQAVADGDVMRVRGYTARRGGYTRFIGGEKRWKAHYQAGLVRCPRAPELGRPALVELTDDGLAALSRALGDRGAPISNPKD